MEGVAGSGHWHKVKTEGGVSTVLFDQCEELDFLQASFFFFFFFFLLGIKMSTVKVICKTIH